MCLTCISGGIACSSCYQGHVLVGGSCLACLDPNALACLPTNLNFSISCTPKYSAATSSSSSGGYCLPCASNCLKCDINGPGNCDSLMCLLGFVQLSGTLNCTACFNSCPICDSNDPNLCLDCGSGRYTDGSGICLVCSSGCQACTSASSCSACLLGYNLVNSICIASPKYPCVAINNNSQCSSCFFGYVLNGTSCAIDTSCNNTHSCVNCAYGYYLKNSSCFGCPVLPNCVTCNANSECILCTKGHYLTSAGCAICANNCKDCSSSSYCSEASDGNYLIVNIDGSNSGHASACSSPCLTCSFSQDYCLACITGYNISGSVCQSN